MDDDNFLKGLPIFEAERRLSIGSNEGLATSSSSSLKRSRTVTPGSFDMSEFIEASKQVEDSIAFPVIEWPAFDDDEDGDDSDGESFCVPRPSKRRCKGLVRCNRSSNLSTLTPSSSSSSSGSLGF
jgi:hypothetical protein